MHPSRRSESQFSLYCAARRIYTKAELAAKLPNISQIENAFLPAKEIDTPDRFAGRKEHVQNLTLALLSSGTNIAIVGNRGIGKSSLARQLISLATDNRQLLDRLKISCDHRFDFLCLYFTCGSEVSTCHDLLERLLTTKSCLQDWIYDIPAARKELQSIQPKIGVSIASLQTNSGSESTFAPAVSDHKLDTVFTNVLLALSREKIADDGILIIVDEFDQIKDPSGFAGLLKSLATTVPAMRFCLVGVAHDLQKLIREHESADRLFAGGIIQLPPMNDSELKEIVSIAESTIGNAIQFDTSARNELVSLAQGHPYMVHLIGKYALRQAFREQNSVIGRTDIQKALSEIAERAADPVLEDRYKKAVASSPAREIVLRALSHCRKLDGEIHTTDAYKIALDEGVENASQYVGHLVTPDYGQEIQKVRERYYRFRDSLFYAYVSARPRIFPENFPENVYESDFPENAQESE